LRKGNITILILTLSIADEIRAGGGGSGNGSMPKIIVKSKKYLYLPSRGADFEPETGGRREGNRICE
jgi:hypothetical protein